MSERGRDRSDAPAGGTAPSGGSAPAHDSADEQGSLSSAAPSEAVGVGTAGGPGTDGIGGVGGGGSDPKAFEGGITAGTVYTDSESGRPGEKVVGPGGEAPLKAEDGG